MNLHNIKEWLREVFFQFTPAQIKAIFFMTIVVLILTYISHDPDHLFYKPFHADSSFIKEYQDFINQLEPKTEQPYLNRLDRYILKRYDTIKLFPFDPNTASRQTLLKLGLTEKQANTLINYRKKGGHFYIKDDFRRLYGMRYMQYKILKPYLLLPDSNTYKRKAGHKYAYQTDSTSYQLFPFDPNTISADSLELLGFSKRQAQSIIRAREKGWHFRTKKDFSKLYVVSDKKFAELQPYIMLPDSVEYKKHKKAKSQSYSTGSKLELNTADKESLQHALHIQPWVAERIVKYRNKLGGFYSKQQLKEVYGFPREKYNEISQQVYVDTTKISKINLLTASYGEMVHHPYIDRDLANWIIKRRQKGKLHNANDLRKYRNLDPYELAILLHYIKFE